ncbi:MAG: hypothetical protein WD557_02225 [Dehalococcoidia bacterium]
MTFLHIADSANHAGFGGPVGWVAALVGVGAGAFVVFGLPAILERRRARDAARIAGPDSHDNT